MDVSRLRKKDIKAWLPIDDDVSVLCKYVGQTEFDAISDSADKNGKRDEKKFRSDLAQAVVQDWKGLEDEGQPFPCTPENISWLMEESTDFRLLIMDAPLSMKKMLAAEKAAEIKK